MKTFNAMFTILEKPPKYELRKRLYVKKFKHYDEWWVIKNPSPGIWNVSHYKTGVRATRGCWNTFDEAFYGFMALLDLIYKANGWRKIQRKIDKYTKIRKKLSA